MKTMLKAMQKKNSGIPEEILPVFEGIIQEFETRDARLSAPCRKTGNF